MAQRVTLSIPNPTTPSQDINLGVTGSPLVVSGGGSSSSPDIVGFGPAAAPADGVSNVNYSVGLYDNTATARVSLRTANTVFDGSSWNRMRGDTVGTYTVAKGTGSLATNQISVATTAGGTLIVAARAGRARVTITNLGTTDVFVGNTGLTAANGQILIGTKGASITLHTSAAVYGIAGTAQSVSFIEEF